MATERAQARIGAAALGVVVTVLGLLLLSGVGSLSSWLSSRPPGADGAGIATASRPPGADGAGIATASRGARISGQHVGSPRVPSPSAPKEAPASSQGRVGGVGGPVAATGTGAPATLVAIDLVRVPPSDSNRKTGKAPKTAADRGDGSKPEKGKKDHRTKPAPNPDKRPGSKPNRGPNQKQDKGSKGHSDEGRKAKSGQTGKRHHAAKPVAAKPHKASGNGPTAKPGTKGNHAARRSSTPAKSSHKHKPAKKSERKHVSKPAPKSGKAHKGPRGHKR